MPTPKRPTAVIVKGNPKFVRGNAVARAFYEAIAGYLRGRGYRVTFDPGRPYTSPKAADLWIGHSRGVDRLRFAPNSTRTLAFGSAVPGAINHPRDASRHIYGPTDVLPNRFHYVFTVAMRRAIDGAAVAAEKKKAPVGSGRGRRLERGGGAIGGVLREGRSGSLPGGPRRRT